MVVLEIVENIADIIEQEKDYLTELDRAIGDSDHGTNLSRGFQKIKEEKEELKMLNSSDLFNRMAMILISNVGGASGAIYGTGLMKIAQSLKGKDTLDMDTMIVALDAMIAGIKMRGKAELGEKTMLDTIVPAVEVLKVDKNKSLNILLEEVETASKKGMESTENMMATKGRASYLGERSRGHIDPGAMSSYLIIKTIC
uniref:dihydroxyacetone kinase subunit DhaL n=1 Tax=uncultured Cetobacterium sp. TaxID=527638 RepID=UPI002623E37A